MAVQHTCMLPLAMLSPGETLAVLPGHMSAVALDGACRVTDSVRGMLSHVFDLSHVQPEGERKTSASPRCFYS